MYCISQRADHVWEDFSSATTRSRPIINSRDEPHSDANLYRRLHVIVGDSNMSEYASFLKVAACGLVLRMVEESGTILRDMTLENPIRAIREISHDVTCQRTVRLVNGRELRALDMQREFLDRAIRFSDHHEMSVEEKMALEMWEHCLTAIEKDPLTLRRECDWVAKYLLIEEYRERHNLPLADPRLALMDLQYHEIRKETSLFYLLQNRDLLERTLTESEIDEAISTAPQTTRARLRGEFIKRAREQNRDYTVDWVHLKLNDHPQQRSVLCKDPFKFVDERVEKLIESL